MTKNLAKALLAGAAMVIGTPVDAQSFEVRIPATEQSESISGRLIFVLTKDDETEPRFQVGPAYDDAQIFGVPVANARPGDTISVDSAAMGYPIANLKEIPAGSYQVQAVLHRYEKFPLSTGQTVELPAARGAGQNWRLAPGNLVSAPQQIDFDPTREAPVALTLDQTNPVIEEPEDTEFVRHFKIRSERLSKFWGRDVFIRGHVLVPRGFDDHPEAHYPLMVFHGHFPADFGGFRTTPPDPALECQPSERFGLPCYNRTEQLEAYNFYKKWNSDDFPRYLVVEIDHSNPYYDDSYAVNSANLGPYGDAITYDFIPELERRYRGLGEGWSRFLYGGSTGGWEALAAQVKYPDEYNGAFAACPDPIDFRQLMTTNIYEDDNAYSYSGTFGKIDHPGKRDYLGRVPYTMKDENRWEYVLGDRNRSGAQWDIWEAVFSPMGADGYPRRLWDKLSGKIDPEVAAYWRENYDLRHILQRDWETIGPKLQGKIHIYVGDMDNYYLNNAVYLMEDFLEQAKPAYEGEVDYGDRAEHCWSGDQANSNAISRLRYNSFYLPKILKRIEDSAPEGADLTSWRY